MSWADMCEDLEETVVELKPTVEAQCEEFVQQRHQQRNQQRQQQRQQRQQQPRLQSDRKARRERFPPRTQPYSSNLSNLMPKRPEFPSNVCIRTMWTVPTNLNYFAQLSEPETEETRLSMTGVRESLKSLKNQIQEASVWPDVWRAVIESNWVLGRINQACLLRPFSRAFFKLLELNHHLCFIPPKPLISSFSAICLGEAPGGFVHAISWCRSQCLTDGPWLSRDDPMSSYSVEIVSLPEDTWPDQLSSMPARNHLHCFNLVKDSDSRNLFARKFAGSADLVTADGGFEVQQDRRNEQELEMLSLIAAEIEVALQVIKPGGTLVLKLFAMDRQETRALVLKTIRAFESCSLCIPVASKPSNDERYIVARNYKGHGSDALFTDETQMWDRWFDYYCFEDKLRQRDPLTSALELFRTMTPNTRFPLEPALGNAKNYCAELGLPVKQIFSTNK